MRERSQRLVVSLALALVVVTAGCAGGSELGASQAAGDPEEATPMATEAPVAADGAAGGGESGDAAAELRVRERAIIRTGHVSLRVENFDAATRNLTRAVRRYGGFVSDSRVRVHRVDNATYKTGEVVLRVPRGNFSAMLAHAKAVGRVEAASTTSKDVTEKLVDINARLKNLRAERDRLRKLYRTANDTEEILAVEERLSEVQGEIERLEAKRKALRRRVALATIRIELQEPRPDERLRDDRKWYETSLGAAFAASVGGVATTLRALVVAAAYALPYLLVFGLPVVGLGYLGWRRRRSGEPPADDSPPGDGSDPSDADPDSGGDGDGEGSGDTEDAPADSDE